MGEQVATIVGPRLRTALAICAAVGLALSLWPAAAHAAGDSTRTVSFRGVSVSVPATWPVRHLAGRPGCVRFDQHAVYLGDPSPSTCPPHLVGRTEAVHVTTGSFQGVVSPDRVVTAAGSKVGVVVSAGQHPAAAARIAASVRYRGATADVTAPAGRRDARTFASASGSSSTTTATPAGQASPSDTTYTGLGFDACTAPPLSTMATWFAASPYKAANMYIGGASRGCSQPNLTADWVTQTIAQGWTLIPTYVGLQAPCVQNPNIVNRISRTKATAAAQGSAAADDAVAQMDALGLPVGNPVYFDMEGYPVSSTYAVCNAAVLAFENAWTARLHARGYVSGIYGSADSTMAQLVGQQSNAAFQQPDDVWIARWNGDPTLTDPAVPAQYWANHQRIHQYRGGHTESYGGISVNIDNNSLDAAVSPSQLAADGAFVQVAGRPEIYRMAGGAPIFVSDWSAVGGVQPVNTLSQSQFDSLPDRPDDGTFLESGATGRIWRVVTGIASYVVSWAPYGGPQPRIVIDQAALDNAGTGGVWNRLTSGRPAPRMTGPTTFGTYASKASFTWFGGYSSSAVATYDVRWHAARWDGTYGPWTYPTSWQRTPVSDVPLGLRAGYTSCVSVRARNRAGQLSDWTSGRCVARAVDDRTLARSSGWTAKTGDGYVGRTYLVTTRKGATLTRSSARVRRVGVVASTCRTCGKVTVYVGGKWVGTVNLARAGSTTSVLMLRPFALRRGTVTVRVVSSGARVRIDGLVLSRS
jgi:hypothetical protein